MRTPLASAARGRDESRAVAPLELFFDLVYVFAISQLTHHLVEHVDLRTAAETLVLTLAVVYTWLMAGWLSNWLSPTQRPTQALLVGIMLGSLLMSGGLGGAFDDRAWLFVGAYVAIQLGRTAFAIAALAEPRLHTHFVNALGWELVTGALWIAGAAAGDDARLALWAAAAALTYAGMLRGHPVPGRSSHLISPVHGTDVVNASFVAGEHFFERGRLFFLIALGETLVTTGATFAGVPVGVGSVAALVCAFAGAVALASLYFQRAEGVALRASEEAGDASGLAVLGTSSLTLLVLALVTIAVGDELAIAHPGEDPDLAFQLLAFGGPALFLVAQVLFIARIGGARLAAGRVAGIAALAVLAVATAATTLLVASLAATLVLVVVAVREGSEQPTG